MLVVFSAVYLRFRFVDGTSALMALPVVAGTLLFASFPFIASGHLGIPGIGVNNDMAAHLIWADWLQDPAGKAPSGILIGYPLGPHGLVATLADGLGSEPLYMFLGLLLAIPVITGLTALNVLRELPPVRRSLAACLVALPYMAASTLGIASFKELLAALFLLAFALTLRSIPRAIEGRLALIAAAGVLAAAMVATYSYPGLAWLAAAAGVWAVGELVLAARRGAARRGPRGRPQGGAAPDRGRRGRAGGRGGGAAADQGLHGLGRGRQHQRHRLQAPLRRPVPRVARGLAERRVPARHLGRRRLAALRPDRRRRAWASPCSGGCAAATSRCPRPWSARGSSTSAP